MAEDWRVGALSLGTYSLQDWGHDAQASPDVAMDYIRHHTRIGPAGVSVDRLAVELLGRTAPNGLNATAQADLLLSWKSGEASDVPPPFALQAGPLLRAEARSGVGSSHVGSVGGRVVFGYRPSFSEDDGLLGEALRFDVGLSGSADHYASFSDARYWGASANAEATLGLPVWHSLHLNLGGFGGAAWGRPGDRWMTFGAYAGVSGHLGPFEMAAHGMCGAAIDGDQREMEVALKMAASMPLTDSVALSLGFQYPVYVQGTPLSRPNAAMNLLPTGGAPSGELRVIYQR